MTASSRQRGFTLLEALVALVVISIGLLGLLGLQTVAIVNTQISNSQTLASIAAADIADRIRANPTVTAAQAYASITPSSSKNKPNTQCRDTACQPAQLARLDAWEWQTSVADRLPAGRGTVECAKDETVNGTTSCHVFSITVAWSGRSGSANAQSILSDPNCAASNDGSSGAAPVRCFTTEVQL